MILGVGTDVCDIERMTGVVERQGARFLHRIFTLGERTAAAARPEPTKFYARRFAAKEACAKALRTGITGRVRWLDIEILNARNGEPVLTLTGGALARLKRLTPKRHEAIIHVSLSDDPPMALAFVIIEARARPTNGARRPKAPQ
jgi:holo-[acyl-carrier protein] synthase